MIGIDIAISGNARAVLDDALARTRNPQGLLKVAARRVRNVLVKHFRTRDTEGNRLGGDRTHWWRSVADSVATPVVGTTEATVSVTEPGIALQVFGGRVTPKRAKALTIPVHPLAHGRAASVFERETGKQLFQPMKKGGKKSRLLAALDDDGEGFEVFYLLSGGVTVPADSRALPPKVEIASAVVEETTKFLSREQRRTV